MAEKIALSDFIEHVREQLGFAWVSAENQRIRFLTKSIELEMQVTVGKEAGGGVKVWLLEGSGKAKGETVQKIKMTIEPVEVDPEDPDEIPRKLRIADRD